MRELPGPTTCNVEPSTAAIPDKLEGKLRLAALSEVLVISSV